MWLAAQRQPNRLPSSQPSRLQGMLEQVRVRKLAFRSLCGWAYTADGLAGVWVVRQLGCTSFCFCCRAYLRSPMLDSPCLAVKQRQS